MPVHFLNPAGFWLALGIIPIVACYILKFRRPKVVVASLRFFRASLADSIATHPFRKLRAHLPLILQLLVLLLVTLGAARPTLRSSGIHASAVVFVFDGSASMLTHEASDGGRTRFERAIDEAKRMVVTLPPAAEVVLITASHTPLVDGPAERDTRKILAALDHLHASPVDGDLAAAVTLAVDRLHSMADGHGELWVFSDGAFGRSANGAPPTSEQASLLVAAAGLSVHAIDLGKERENCAIIAVDSRREPSTDTIRVFAAIQNFGETPRDVTLSVGPENSDDSAQPPLAPPLASVHATLKSGERLPLTLTVRGSHQALVLQLSPPDANAADNSAFAVVEGNGKPQVIVASTHQASFLTRALASDPTIDLRVLSPEQLESIPIDPDALVFTEGFCPKTVHGYEWVAVAPWANTKASTAGDPVCAHLPSGTLVNAPMISSFDTADPRMRYLSFDGVNFAKAHTVRAAGQNALLRSDNGALIVDASAPGHPTTLLSFELEATDWPSRTSFVVFVRNLVERYRLARENGAHHMLRTGGVLRVSVPQETREVELIDSDKVHHTLVAKDGVALVTATENIGFMHLSWPRPGTEAARDTRIYSVNLLAPAESTIAPQPVRIENVSSATESGHQPQAVSDSGRQWASEFALLALLIVGLELWFAARGPKRIRTAAVRLVKRETAS